MTEISIKTANSQSLRIIAIFIIIIGLMMTGISVIIYLNGESYSGLITSIDGGIRHGAHHNPGESRFVMTGMIGILAVIIGVGMLSSQIIKRKKQK